MFQWTTVEQEAFDTLRERLKNAPFMEYPNDTGTFTLETDASGQSIGFLLTQSRPNKEDGIVACGGRSLRGAEYNYTVTELEMLSVVEALIDTFCLDDTSSLSRIISVYVSSPV